MLKSLKHLNFLFITCFILFLSPSWIYSQIQYPGTPATFSEKIEIPFINLPDAQIIPSTGTGAVGDTWPKLKSSTFAVFEPVSIDVYSRGVWVISEEGVNTCLLGLYSNNATSLGLVFDSFELKPGMTVFVYTPDKSVVLGAFNFKNNKGFNAFPITPINNDSIIIELQYFTEKDNTPALLIGGVGIGFRKNPNLKSANDKWYKQSASCEVDINCVSDLKIQNQKYSVVRIIYDGSSRCTGTLLNNTARNAKPLVLTAGHCISTARQAATAVFYFDYESPFCNGPDGTIKSVAGSELLAYGEGDLDFSLVELSEMPPLEYKPLYAGWTNTEELGSYHYVMHHPEGDVKKVSEVYDVPIPISSHMFDFDTHWLVSNYGTGSTEFGSSGAALFNEAGQVIGTLSAGNEACSQDINDYYQKFSASWSGYSEESKQLKKWLDPINSGETEIGNLQLDDEFLKKANVITNLTAEDQYSTNTPSDSWGYYSGHNSNNTLEYGEHFSIKGSKYIYAVDINLSHLYAASSESSIKLNIRDLDTPDDEIIFTQEVFLFELNNGKNTVYLDSLVLADRNFSVGYQIKYENPMDTLAVNLSAPSGFRLKNTAFSYNNQAWQPIIFDNENIYTSLAIGLYVFDFYLPQNVEDIENYPKEIVTLYPNPTYDQLQILFKNQPEGIVQIGVYDVFGRMVKKFSIDSPERNFRLDLGSLTSGAYTLVIDYPGGSETKRVVKIN